MKFCTFLLFALVTLTTANVHATLISKGLFSQNDNLITLDTESNLEWLDLTATNGISVIDVVNGYGEYLNNRFRYATRSEIFNLYLNAGIVGFGPYQHSGMLTTGSLTENFLPVQNLISLMGCTATCENTPNIFPFGHRPVMAGLFGVNIDTPPSFAPSSSISLNIHLSNFPNSDNTARALIANQFGSVNVASNGTGSFLVREASNIPEPISVALFGIGLFMIITISSRKKQVTTKFN